MYIANRCFHRSAKSILRAGEILALVLLWQTTASPLMGQFGSTVQQFPQVVVNGGSTTSFTVHNPSSTKTINVSVQLYLPDGTALADQQVELTAGATKTLVFGDPQASLTRGSAELKSDDDFIATEFFQLFIGETKPRVGVLPSPPSEEVRFLGFVNNQFTSGMAVHNPSPTEQTQFTVRVKDMAGQQPVPEKMLTLDPLQSEAAFLNEPTLFGEGLSNFEGVVEISVNSPPVAVLSLIQETSGDVATVAVETQSFVLTGETNTSLGRGALSSNTTGDHNTANGANALRDNTEGRENTANGFQALLSNTTGGGNTANGFNSLFANTTGIFNTATGGQALFSNTTGNFNTATGLSALFSNKEGSGNTATGDEALGANTTGSNNTANGVGALQSNTEGSNNTVLGFSADVSAGDLTNAAAIGAGAIVDASDKIRLGNANVTVIEGAVGYTFTSDKTKKQNFQPVDGEEVLRKLRSLEIPSWNLTGQDPGRFRHYGPMAQDFFAAFGQDGVGTIGTPTTINTSDLAGILMIAVQTLGRRTKENAELKVRVEELERAIQKMHPGPASGGSR